MVWWSEYQAQLYENSHTINFSLLLLYYHILIALNYLNRIGATCVWARCKFKGLIQTRILLADAPATTNVSFGGL